MTDDLESFFHVLVIMYLRFHEHEMTLDKSLPENTQLSHFINAVYLMSYKSPEGYDMGSNFKLTAMRNGDFGISSFYVPDEEEDEEEHSPFVLLLIGLLRLFKAHYRRNRKIWVKPRSVESAATAPPGRNSETHSTAGQTVNPGLDRSCPVKTETDREELDHDAVIKLFEMVLAIKDWSGDEKLDYDQFKQLPKPEARLGSSASTTQLSSDSLVLISASSSRVNKRIRNESSAGPSKRPRPTE